MCQHFERQVRAVKPATSETDDGIYQNHGHAPEMMLELTSAISKHQNDAVFMKGEGEARRTQRPNETVAEAESEEVGSSRHPHACTARALREARALPGACGAPTRHAHRSSAFRALSISLFINNSERRILSGQGHCRSDC